jgi:hypothetical protein
VWTKLPVGLSLTNVASPVGFTINHANDTVWGAGILSASAKSSVAGTLFAAVQFGAVRNNLQIGDVLSMVYALTGVGS